MAPPYHETFWVVVGTASPVIALATIVAIGQMDMAQTAAKRLGRAFTAFDRLNLAIFLMFAFAFVIQGVTLGAALGSLAHDKDELSLFAANYILIISLGLLFAGTALNIGSLPRLKPTKPAAQDAPEPVSTPDQQPPTPEREAADEPGSTPS